MEIWKDIKNYPGYQVSNFGNVRTFNKITHTDKHGERHWKNRILKQKIQSKKYGRKDARVELWNNGEHKTILVARLIAFTFLEKDINDKNLTVNHIDGNSLNNNVDNLEIISLKENIQHGLRTGLYKNQIKVKIVDKITGTIIYPSSLSEGSKLISKNENYLSGRINKNIFENDKYVWEVI